MSSFSFAPALLLMAQQQSFCLSYLKHVLDQSGAQVIGPFATAQELSEWIETAAELPRAAVLSVASSDAASLLLAAQLEALRIPFVTIQEAANRATPLHPAFTWPFGAFQVVEALEQLVNAQAEAFPPAPVKGGRGVDKVSG